MKGEPVAGIVHKPFAKSQDGQDGQTYWALKGMGIRGIVTDAPKSPLAIQNSRIVFTRSHYTDLIHQTAQALQPKEIIRVGGCGHKTMMVVEGKCDAYVFPSPGTKKWDSCAGDAIIREAGGLMTDVNGELLTYDSFENYRNKLGLVVTMCSEMHKTIIDKIPKHVKEALATK